MAVMIDKETKEAAPVTAFLDGDRSWRRTSRVVNDAARGKRLSQSRHGRWRSLRNYNPFNAPTRFRLSDLLKKFDKTFGATGRNYGKVGERPHAGRRREAPRATAGMFLFIAGMWFQDLFNYDFRRTEQCIIPYAHAGRRDLLLRLQHRRRLAADRREDAHDGDAGASGTTRKAATRSTPAGTPCRWRPPSTRWSSTPGRARGRARRHDLDLAGVAKTAREEKLRAQEQEHVAK
ncbi:MAG: hypothetical protein MZW92_24930 [Comamonadaceae bacterium]|nr:hypothetical protein [Comamonadaceae bacterium]